MALIKDDLLESIKKPSNTLLKCMMIVTAIEFCGSFLTGKTGIRTTECNFLEFWRSKYMPGDYHDKGALIYNILRNGVSHSFIAKGGVVPSNEKESSDKHLKFFNQGIFIYVRKFEEDVVRGLLALLDDLNDKRNVDLRRNYCKVLSDLSGDGLGVYKKFLKDSGIDPLPGIIRGDISLDIQCGVATDSPITSHEMVISSSSSAILGIYPNNHDGSK